MKIVRIPTDRVGALIGKKGEIKQYFEQETGVGLEIDSESGEITLDTEKIQDPLLALKAEDVVRAIGRGFSPEKAFTLLSEDAYFHIIDIHDYVGKSIKHMRRIKARIIGKKGRTRRVIEQLTGATLSIYGGTVAIISDLEGLENSRTAVDMILGGSEHSMVYKLLERKRTELKLAKLDSIFMEAPSTFDEEDDLEEDLEDDLQEDREE